MRNMGGRCKTLRVWLGIALCVVGWAGAAHSSQSSSPNSLAPGVFLIARPGLPDPNFYQSVILLIDYSADGAFSLIINRPTRHPLSQVFPDIIPLGERASRVYRGGPVELRRMVLLLLSTNPPKNSHHVVDNIHFIVDPLTIGEIVNQGDEVLHAYAGYSGWALGQLNNELAREDWRVIPANSETVFEWAPERVWPELNRSSEGIWVENQITARGNMAG